ncbi:hypothetical protein GGI59_001342 [Rhizobium lentis]|uniref:Uncharacterized protein n=1 Tax=Rhizobium lentis TaxID=1138194 RepID=A0A7W8XDC0_9HYPH|nr:hypothetical protein [Rhizobium lentis]MBB5549166.1 hypothetical protein [Rhizobium lentis]MBB5559699.1 hypothetical protein [Rhizobium lentis]MBB5566417.1 hypothetical protein [Rhizobium lentis]
MQGDEIKHLIGRVTLATVWPSLPYTARPHRNFSQFACVF